MGHGTWDMGHVGSRGCRRAVRARHLTASNIRSPSTDNQVAQTTADTYPRRFHPRYRMRTFGLGLRAPAFSATVAALAAAALLAPSLASAQRNSRRAARPAATSEATNTASQPCGSDCGNYSLSVVSALLPSETAGATGSDFVTLVIENRGTAPSPASLVSVAPKTRLASSRMSAIPPLAPGERVTVQLPVEIGPDGTQCVSITIRPAPAQDPARVQVLASADRLPSGAGPEAALPVAPSMMTERPVSPDLLYWPDLPSVPGFDLGNNARTTDFLAFRIAGVV